MAHEALKTEHPAEVAEALAAFHAARDLIEAPRRAFEGQFEALGEFLAQINQMIAECPPAYAGSERRS